MPWKGAIMVPRSVVTLALLALLARCASAWCAGAGPHVRVIGATARAVSAGPRLCATSPSTRGAYGAEQITVLEGLEPVRKRPGMYIGSTGSRGLHHLVFEVVDNAVDEALAGHATRVDVTLHADGTVSVADDGRGIPCDVHAKTGRPALETVLTVLHAGGKFGDSGYKVSSGLHGVGVSVVNALSEYLHAEVRRDGHVHAMEFAAGKSTSEMSRAKLEKSVPKASRTGTTITFRPDVKIFKGSRTFDWSTLATRRRPARRRTRRAAVAPAHPDATDPAPPPQIRRARVPQRGPHPYAHRRARRGQRAAHAGVQARRRDRRIRRAHLRGEEAAHRGEGEDDLDRRRSRRGRRLLRAPVERGHVHRLAARLRKWRGKRRYVRRKTRCRERE